MRIKVSFKIEDPHPDWKRSTEGFLLDAEFDESNDLEIYNRRELLRQFGSVVGGPSSIQATGRQELVVRVAPPRPISKPFSYVCSELVERIDRENERYVPAIRDMIIRELYKKGDTG